MDGVDADDLQLTGSGLRNKVGIVHDHRGIIRAEVDVPVGVKVRLGAVRRDLVRVAVADDATLLPTSGIGAGARLGFVTGTSAAVQAVHTVHAAGARRYAIRIGATARQLAMLASTTLTAKDAAVRRNATAVQAASATITAILQTGAGTGHAVASPDAVYVASTSCLAQRIGAAAHQRGATASASVSADLLTVCVVARAVGNAIGVGAQASRHHAAGAEATVFAVLDRTDASAVQIAFFIVTAARKQRASAIGVTTLESICIITASHRHADGVAAGAIRHNAMAANAVGSAETGQNAVHQAVAGAVFQAGFAGATTGKLSDFLTALGFGRAAAQKGCDVDAGGFDAVQTKQRRIHIDGLIQTDVVTADEEALFVFARMRRIGRAHIEVDQQLASGDTADVKVAHDLQTEDRIHLFAVEVEALAKDVHHNVVHVQLLLKEVRVEEKLGLHADVFKDQGFILFIVEEGREGGHVLRDLGTDVDVDEAAILQRKVALDITRGRGGYVLSVEVFEVERKVQVVLLDRDGGRVEGDGQFDLQRGSELLEQYLHKGAVDGDGGFLTFRSVRDQDTVDQARDQRCVLGRRGRGEVNGGSAGRFADFIALCRGEEVRDKAGIHTLDKELLHVEPRHGEVDLLVQNVHIRL